MYNNRIAMFDNGIPQGFADGPRRKSVRPGRNGENWIRQGPRITSWTTSFSLQLWRGVFKPESCSLLLLVFLLLVDSDP